MRWLLREIQRSWTDPWPSKTVLSWMVRAWSPKQVSGSGHVEKLVVVLAGGLLALEYLVRCPWVLLGGLLLGGLVLEEPMEEQTAVVLPWVLLPLAPVAKQVDSRFRSSKEPPWPAYRPFAICYMNPIRAADFL